jgi:hypothetical protein
MSTHISNFGAYGANLKRYASRDGYLPTDDSDRDALYWGRDWTDDEWDEFRAEATEAIEHAQAGLDGWRSERVS